MAALCCSLALAIAGCGGGEDVSPTATLAPTATAASTATPAPGPPLPEAARIIEHMRVLSDEIGSRLVNSDGIARAAEYATRAFEQYGYAVELQDFSDTSPQARVFGQVTAEQLERDLDNYVFIGSGPGGVEGRLVDAGSGADEEFPADSEGAIVLVQRGETLFNDMATRAAAHGAIGVLVANNRDGLFRGTVEPPSVLPVIAIRQDDGTALREQLENGPVDMRIDVPLSIDGQNIVARPASGNCRTLSGAHYDTVPWAPGAIDNASGAAMVLELARSTAAAGLDGHCFALFSAEEVGLLGSKHYVSEMGADERAALQAYFNFDVVAGGGPIEVIGDQPLATEAVARGSDSGQEFVLRELPRGQSSDHASFALAGVPVLMITVDDLGVLHTADDDFAFASEHTDVLQPIAEIAFELLQFGDQAAAP